VEHSVSGIVDEFFNLDILATTDSSTTETIKLEIYDKLNPGNLVFIFIKETNPFEGSLDNFFIRKGEDYFSLRQNEECLSSLQLSFNDPLRLTVFVKSPKDSIVNLEVKVT
jgi:hypothetical protein